MSRKKTEHQELKVQSYLRLLRYTKPYRVRLITGIIAGFLVGGSLFVSLLLIPQMIGAFAPENDTSAIISTETRQIMESFAQSPEMPEEERARYIESVLNGTNSDDPEMAKMVAKINEAADKYNLPVSADTNRITLSWPAELTIPLVGEDGLLSWQIFAVYMAVFILTWLLRNVAVYVNHYCTRWVGARVVADLREKIFGKLLDQSLSFYSGTDIGQLISRCTNDTSAIEHAVSNTIADATKCPIEILACVSALVYFCVANKSYMLLVILLLGVPALVLPINYLGRKIRRIYRSTYARIAEVFSRMHEVFTGIVVVKAYNTEKREEKNFTVINNKYFRTAVHALRLQLLVSPLMEVVAVSGTMAFLVYAYSQGTTLSDLAGLLAPAFMVYQPIKSLSKVVTAIQQSMAAADRYFDLMDTDTSIKEKPDALEFKEFKDAIRFENVVFGYGSKKVIDGISFDIPRGHLVAVVGETGSGKTTIANLIARFYDPQSGRVTVDGVDIRDYRIGDIHKMIGVVNQDAILFNDTIAGNIAYGVPDASMDDIRKAADQANATKFILDGRHPDGFESEVGEKGFKLSGGEKQRVAIARAILRNPPILILDEATSALDTVTEQLVQEALNRVMTNRTVFAIAHRLSTIRNADKIIVLKHGKIAEAGTHEELLQLGGAYKKLHDTQFR